MDGNGDGVGITDPSTLTSASSASLPHQETNDYNASTGGRTALNNTETENSASASSTSTTGLNNNNNNPTMENNPLSSQVGSSLPMINNNEASNNNDNEPDSVFADHNNQQQQQQQVGDSLDTFLETAFQAPEASATASTGAGAGTGTGYDNKNDDDGGTSANDNNINVNHQEQQQQQQPPVIDENQNGTGENTTINIGDDDSDTVEIIGNPPQQYGQSQLQQQQQQKEQRGDDKISIGSWSSHSSDVVDVTENKSGKTNSQKAEAGYSNSSAGGEPMPYGSYNTNNSNSNSTSNTTAAWGSSTNNGYSPGMYQPPNSTNDYSSYPPSYPSSSSNNHLYPNQYPNQQPPPPQPAMAYIEIPMAHTPTWCDILPKDYYQQLKDPSTQRQPGSTSYYSSMRKKLDLSLINMWEFTITIETIDQYGYAYSGNFGGAPDSYGGRHDAIHGLRAQIKKIARDHLGRDGRKGAIYERGAVMPDDPILKNIGASTMQSEEGEGEGAQQNGEKNAASAGRWRIPLGAYQALMTYLTSDGNNTVEGIPPEQLRAATLGRERNSKDYPPASALIKREVHSNVCNALAPYQRGGVEFILDKEGRALLADEMGLGKTVQAIAAMSAFKNDWPLLVLCPSTARYHWEAEFRCWLGSESKMAKEREANKKKQVWTSTTPRKKQVEEILLNSQINVLTSGKDVILRHGRSTRVVICSIGLIVNLATSGRIAPGMFKAVIVDESHALKSKSTKRTKAVLPLLKAAERCLLLSGTPALARPGELWPQISVLGSRERRRKRDGFQLNEDDEDRDSGVWCDEAEFERKYVKAKGKGDAEGGNKTRLAELHTLLTSTVMIRRMKADILKNLASKIREKAFINITDEGLKNEFRTYMQLLRQGKGVLGKLARQHHRDNTETDAPPEELDVVGGENGVRKNTEVLHHLYNLSGRSKIKRITKMLRSWLADPTKGKLCIFAHHLDVLGEISRGANLSNAKGSMTKYIRIDGSTNPKARQDQILQFQTDPSVRIAMLGITAAGVAVTLTASSTVWFAELFWTPAIMIQAEDRCHRIGQQARVRCLYFIARGTLDEVLWKLIEKKFRDLGEFVEGKENMDIALERELEDGEDEEILKTEGNGSSKKRKAEDVFSELLDTEVLEKEMKEEIDELVNEEENMLSIKNDDEEDPDAEDKKKVSKAAGPSENVIELSDDEGTDSANPPTIQNIRNLYRMSGVLAKLKIEPQVQFSNLRAYTLQYPGPNYGLIMVSCNGRVVVKSHQSPQASPNGGALLPKIGSIIVGVNGYLIPYAAAFNKVLQLMKHFMRAPPVTVLFAEDDDFIDMFVEDFIPNLLLRRAPTTATPAAETAPSSSLVASSSNGSPAVRPRKNSEVIDLLDDD